MSDNALCESVPRPPRRGGVDGNAAGTDVWRVGMPAVMAWSGPVGNVYHAWDFTNVLYGPLGEFCIWPKLNTRGHQCTLGVPTQSLHQKGYPLAQTHCTAFPQAVRIN